MRRKKDRRSRRQIEQLERRLLLAASVVGDLLVVNATGNSDNVLITSSGAQLSVSINAVVQTFNPAQFAFIRVHALAGNDSINLGSEINYPATIFPARLRIRVVA